MVEMILPVASLVLYNYAYGLIINSWSYGCSKNTLSPLDSVAFSDIWVKSNCFNHGVGHLLSLL